jgi:hypothetical protein
MQYTKPDHFGSSAWENAMPSNPISAMSAIQRSTPPSSFGSVPRKANTFSSPLPNNVAPKPVLSPDAIGSTSPGSSPTLGLSLP